MCVACREMRAKKDLMRIVRTADGTLRLDLTGKSNGRGAYLCRDENCVSKAFKTRALERTLETPTDDVLRTAIEAEVLRNGPAV